MRRFAFAAIGTLAGFGIAVACGDPYEGDIPTPAPDRDSAPTVDAAVEAAPIDDASPDVVDAGPDVDVDPCDRDEDGFRAVECDGGTDCDDEDPRAHPDAGFSTDPPTPVTKGDWDCDGTPTPERATGVSCVGFGTSCTSIVGFKGDPGCGTAGNFITCKVNGIGCSVATEQMVTQGCR